MKIVTVLILAAILIFTACNKDEEAVKVIGGYKLTQNETWSGVIELKGDIEIPEGITLIIESGTKILIATSNLVYDEGFEDRFVDIFVDGKLVINGSEDKIVEIGSSSNSPTEGDWWGIGVHSDSQVNIQYCSIRDSKYGFFIFSGTHSNHIFDHCHFSNLGTSVVDFGIHNLKLNHCSFINVDYGYDLWRSDKTASIDYAEFSDIGSHDLYFAGASDDITNNSAINITNSNFSFGAWKNISWSSDGKVNNSTVNISNCYGTVTYPEPAYGNKVVLQNMLANSIQGAGCGFSAKLKSAKPLERNEFSNTGEDLQHENEIQNVVNKFRNTLKYSFFD
jgi:hypothetical protein